MELSNQYTHYLQQVNIQMKTKGELPVVLMETDDEDFIPIRKHPSDAGFDCRARLDKPITLGPGERAIIPLGFGINIPLHHTGDLRPRSGLTSKHGIMVGYGTIDAGYTGEVKATIFNLGNEAFTIHPKDRIAQLVLLPIATTNDDRHVVSFRKVDQLVELERGDKGHGSTGVK